MRGVGRAALFLWMSGVAPGWTAESHEPLIRFPDVSRGGEWHVTHGTERPLRVHYDAHIEPKTFRATLNGKDVSRLFHPASRDRGEAVRLPLNMGENTLRIEVNSREAAADPRSALLPQEHLLKIRMDPMAVGGRVEARTFSSQDELEAYLKQEDERLGGR